jgi:hypothetical protein
VSLLLVAPWFLAVRSSSGEVGDRSVAFHPPGLSELPRLGRGLGDWFLPAAVGGTTLLVLGVLALLVVWPTLFVARTARREAVRPDDRLVGELIVFSACYVAAVLVARTFFDPNIPFDQRIFMPLGLTVVAVVVLRVSAVWPSIEPRSLQVGLVGLLAVLLLGATVSTASVTHAAYQDGLGYEGPEWDESETLAYVASLDPDKPVVSNGPDVVWLRLDRGVDRLPNRAWPDGLDRLEQELLDGGGVVVHFDDIHRSYYPEPDELVADGGLVVVEDLEDGVVLAAARS